MTDVNRLNGAYNAIRRICRDNHAESIMVKLPCPTEDRRTWTIVLKDIRTDAMRERVKAAIGRDLCETVELIGESKRTLTYQMDA